MPRNMPERDDQGRFVSDDDRGRGGDDRRRYSSSRRDDDTRRSSRYDDADRGRGHGAGSATPAAMPKLPVADGTNAGMIVTMMTGALFEPRRRLR
jgi:hypothetical protein